ncbi:ORF1p [Operophtera brumata]|uniref:ORF1p n=1 Tax=Operophtera brumata TaxID=104452 RepID=A0A0L7L4E5_OPEBR|nr:ORF1p [Operophtera brumata]
MVPNNCDLLLAPTLNPEVKAALPDTLVKWDSSLVYKQKQLGIALSALATVTEMIIANETSKQKMLKPLSDACRILCDSHYVETRTRRGFVISSINTKLRDALIESSRDKLLFGDNVSEKLKAAKTIQLSGESLKNAQKPKFQRPNNIASTSGNKSHLNFMPQHRKTDNKPNNYRRATNYSQRQTHSSSSAPRPSDRRPLPAKTSAAHHRR